jgi:hypothetical protein
MSITPILKPFEGERVVGVSPVPSARVDDWNRRLNLFTGRALSDTALTVGQNGTAGRLALRGQSKSTGVVTGLETGLEKSADGSFFLHVGPGLGVATGGEDVVIPVPLRVNVRDIHVFGPVSLLDSGTAPTEGALVDRKLGDALDALIKQGRAIPQIGFVLLQPIVADTFGNFDPTDQCEEDPSNDAFADEQLVDGCRVIYYAWPAEWLPLPAPGDQFRNRLAYALFESDAGRGPNEFAPWEQVGVPIGLLAFDTSWNPLFIERSAVVRQGGKPKRRTPLAPGFGNPFLWQARIQQFAEHLTDLDATNAKPEDLAKELKFLPPVGLLPKSALNFQPAASAGTTTRVSGSNFFPSTFTVNAVPAPAEELDVAVCACASLEPLDTSLPDEVTVLVPVPRAWYEPDLLQVMSVDLEFQNALDDFVHRRGLWLKRRDDVRKAKLALDKALQGQVTPYPDSDPDAVEQNEEIAATQLDPNIDAFKDPEQSYGTESGAAPGDLAATELNSLREKLKDLPGVSSELAELDKPDVGLEQFVTSLQAKADNANDLIDLTFLHVQTNIYRTRQHLLGTDAAMRLAVSPALATIAQSESALATREGLQALLNQAKQAPEIPPRPAAPSRPGAAPPGPPPATLLKHYAPVLRTSRHVARSLTAPKGVRGARPAAPPPPHIVESTARPWNISVNLGKSGLLLPPRTTTAERVHAVSHVGAPELFRPSSASTPTSEDVVQQRPIIGATYDIRTTSVIERLKDPPSSETKAFTVAAKHNAIAGFKASGLKIDDIEIPGFLEPTTGNEQTKKFGDITDDDLTAILNGDHDWVADHADESTIFAGGVRAMEHTTQISRLIEARVETYRTAIDLVKASLDAINAFASSAEDRLQSIESDLSTTRHDVSVARTLLAEETSRVQGINDRRDQIVAQHVSFLAFYRPRTCEALVTPPARPINPGVTETAVPAALARQVSPPTELRAMVNLLRNAPLRWFAHLPTVLDRMDLFETLQGTVVYAKQRAGFRLFDAPDPDPETRAGPLGPHILRVFNAHKQVLTQERLTTANLDLTTFAGRTWQESRDLAPDFVSLGDLTDVGHLQPDVSRFATAEIDNILKVASSLYSDFGAVLPAIRLSWAERLIQIEGPVILANLSSLPRWGEIPILERKEMQALTDWLYSRINLSVPAALAHMNDLVKVCILLASHAPVAEIIAGSVIRPTPIVKGNRIDLTADLARVRIGMHVLMYSGNKSVAHGVVENLASGQATARVLTVVAKNITLDRHAKVHFAHPAAFQRNPNTAHRLLK